MRYHPVPTGLIRRASANELNSSAVRTSSSSAVMAMVSAAFEGTAQAPDFGRPDFRLAEPCPQAPGTSIFHTSAGQLASWIAPARWSPPFQVVGQGGWTGTSTGQRSCRRAT